MDTNITLDYGSGGKKTSELIEKLIVPAMGCEELSKLGDGAVLAGPENGGRLVFSTDSFVVDPLFFSGGNIGKLSVCGTVNDISVSGGKPMYISLAAVIEEGFPSETLEKIISSVRKAADEAGVKVVTGDTKVVEKGKGDGIYLNTSGIGFLKLPGLSPEAMKDGDKVLVSGTMGDHGTAIMLARNPNLVKGDIKSDCAPLNSLTEALFELKDSLRVMRDPTRGGLATTLCEFTEGTDLSIELDESAVPVSKEVKSACDILGLDPLYAANEGKLIAVVSAEKAQQALEIMQNHPLGKNAAIIGEVKMAETDAAKGKVIIRTTFGGRRALTKLTGAQLPRIC